MDLPNASHGQRLRIHQVLASHLIGGAGLIGLHLAEHVRDLGHESTAWVPGRGPATEHLERVGLPWRRYGLERLKRGGGAQAVAAGSFGVRIGLSRPDLVHVHNPTIYGLMSPALRMARARVVVHFHIDPTQDEVRWALRHRPAAVITCSKHIQSLIRDFWDVSEEAVPIVAVQNAVDLTRFHSGDKTEAKHLVNAPVDRPLLLMMANLAPHKGQLTALRALRHLLDRGVDAEAWFAGEERGGDGTFARELQQLTASLGLEHRVRWLGFRTDGPLLMRASDFFLLPSTHEGLPLSVLEAQASGTIALGSPIPGIAEVIQDGMTGFLVDPEAAQTYADRIESAVKSPDLADGLRRRAMTAVEARHSWAGYLANVRGLYARLLSGV